MNIFLIFRFGMKLSKKKMSVGIILQYSWKTVSQLNCFTASILSLRMESCASELIFCISSRILHVNLTTADFVNSAEVNIVDASDL